NCLLLVLLILAQLPKKESGSGLAFGGGALDMALGAGAASGLAKLTKFSATLFLILCLMLAIIGNPNRKNNLGERLGAQNQPASVPAETPSTTPAATPGNASTVTPAATPADAEVTGKADKALADTPDTAAPPSTKPDSPPTPPEKPLETTTPPKGNEKP
ncbi:MAG: preprotein translocase subunit SecG, partial [Verrucomicrobiota bacterium]|nr:preprotein translocase subunit SecG [Verrucomicrobiota bacterium]